MKIRLGKPVQNNFKAGKNEKPRRVNGKWSNSNFMA